ncbi:hypothetical protein [Corynebacterium sphenisci]|uniref:hypothetical protein n=1 Tax=Corynebacterium sphenisci TaxID=191493 RepID=UPI0026E04093|nr:hypothetical protein [Corynebacterium sphenisci]MDO5731723.1 hypothetical protein [Corynebacterium sphenisci]
MAHYDLYEKLNLSPHASSSALRLQINHRLEDVDYDDGDALEPLQVGMAVLGDERKRRLYDRQLADASLADITFEDLRQLAEMKLNGGAGDADSEATIIRPLPTPDGAASRGERPAPQRPAAQPAPPQPQQPPQQPQQPVQQPPADQNWAAGAQYGAAGQAPGQQPAPGYQQAPGFPQAPGYQQAPGFAPGPQGGATPGTAPTGGDQLGAAKAVLGQTGAQVRQVPKQTLLAIVAASVVATLVLVAGVAGIMRITSPEHGAEKLTRQLVALDDPGKAEKWVSKHVTADARDDLRSFLELRSDDDYVPVSYTIGTDEPSIMATFDQDALAAIDPSSAIPESLEDRITDAYATIVSDEWDNPVLIVMIADFGSGQQVFHAETL